MALADLFRPQRGQYRFLGIPRDKLARKESADRSERYKLESLSWETALAAARKFSNGRPCAAGEGAGSGLQRVPEVQGGYNLCFWVQVEGESQQWVVRFPLKGLVSDETTLTRLRSEIATIQFLHRRTNVPVPALIGYNVNDDHEFPLFMIMESVEGMRMTYLLTLDLPQFIIEQVCRDLVRIHMELLSHPSDRIGMLDILEEDGNDLLPTPTIGPYSLDCIEHELDGVYTSKPEPFRSAKKYYDYKLGVWRQRLESQRNSVTSIGDGRRKALDETILSEGITQICHGLEAYDEGPFYLLHPDLHASNIILDMRTFHILAIIDWEGACFLPLTSSCTPPKALFRVPIDGLVPGSSDYMDYYSRSKTYVEIFSAKEKKLLTESVSESEFITVVGERMKSYLEDDMVLLIWAVDDVRAVDYIAWQNLTPRLFPDLGVRLDTTIAQFTDVEEKARAVSKLFSEFALERLAKEKDLWIKAKLRALEEYKKDLSAGRTSKSRTH